MINKFSSFVENCIPPFQNTVSHETLVSNQQFICSEHPHPKLTVISATSMLINTLGINMCRNTWLHGQEAAGRITYRDTSNWICFRAIVILEKIPWTPGPRVGTGHPLLSPPPPKIVLVSSSVAMAKSVHFTGVVVLAELPLILLGCLTTFPDPVMVGEKRSKCCHPTYLCTALSHHKIPHWD